MAPAVSTGPSSAAVAALAASAGVAAGALAAALYYRRNAPKCKPLADKSGGAHAVMLISEDGTKILKPLDQGTVEVDNYSALTRTSLGPFLPGFYGVRSIAGYEAGFMVLDSAYVGMEPPFATLDIKIGKRTWDDHATPEKIEKESKKFDELYTKSSAMEGFRVAGMKAGSLSLASENLKSRHSLLTGEFGQWLLPAFFSSHPGYGPLPAGMAGECRPSPSGACAVDLASAREALGQLKALAAAAELGFGGTLRAASLLLTREMRTGGRWRIKLIDLMHYTLTSEARDDNFCDGLQNLIRSWEKWLASAGGA